MELGAFGKSRLYLGDDLRKVSDKLPHFRDYGSVEGHIDAVGGGRCLGCLYRRNQRAQRTESQAS